MTENEIKLLAKFIKEGGIRHWCEFDDCDDHDSLIEMGFIVQIFYINSPEYYATTVPAIDYFIALYRVNNLEEALAAHDLKNPP